MTVLDGYEYSSDYIYFSISYPCKQYASQPMCVYAQNERGFRTRI